MNIPNKVKIGGFTYAVENVEHLMRDRDSSGESCGNQQTITLDSSASNQLRETSFIHEVLHQIDYTYHIELKHDQVYQLEAGIFAFIKDNPEIFHSEDPQKDGD